MVLLHLQISCITHCTETLILFQISPNESVERQRWLEKSSEIFAESKADKQAIKRNILSAKWNYPNISKWSFWLPDFITERTSHSLKCLKPVPDFKNKVK